MLSRFGETRSEAIKGYREFVAEGLRQGPRPDLMGGGLVRSVGGWQAVKELRRGREAFAFDERILGSSEFVEKLLREAEERARNQTRTIDIPTLGTRICRDMGVSWEAVLGGGRFQKVAKARAVLAYAWVRYLGRSGSDLARAFGVSRQAVSAAARGTEENPPSEKDIARWCHDGTSS